MDQFSPNLQCSFSILCRSKDFSSSSFRSSIHARRNINRLPPTSFQELNGHISATGHLIHFMFGSSRLGFSRLVDRMVLLLVGSNPHGGPHHLENFKWSDLCNGSSDAPLVWFCGRFYVVCSLNSATSGWTKSKMVPAAFLKNFQMMADVTK